MHEQNSLIRIQELFKKNEAKRFPNNIRIRYNKGKIYYELPSIWNNIPEQIKTSSLKQLTKTLKEQTLKEYANQTCNKQTCYACSIQQ